MVRGERLDRRGDRVRGDADVDAPRGADAPTRQVPRAATNRIARGGPRRASTTGEGTAGGGVPARERRERDTGAREARAGGGGAGGVGLAGTRPWAQAGFRRRRGIFPAAQPQAKARGRQGRPVQTAARA